MAALVSLVNRCSSRTPGSSIKTPDNAQIDFNYESLNIDIILITITDKE